MKKLLAAAIAGTMMLAGGCMKVDNTVPDHIFWGAYGQYYYPAVSFITAFDGGRSIVFSGGSRADFENPEKINESAGFLELVINLGLPEDEGDSWEYEFDFPSLTRYGLFELKIREWDGENFVTSVISTNISSGKVTIEHLEGEKYKVEFSGSANGNYSDSNGNYEAITELKISAKTENIVKFVEPE